MKYNLKINDSEPPVLLEIENIEEGSFTVVQERGEKEVSFQRVDDNLLLLTIEGRQVKAYVDPESSPMQIVIQGVSYYVEDADEQGTSRKKKGLSMEPTEVTPPMPAVVVRVLVTEGDTVTKGQGVAVVSAMKMETTLNAPFDGTVIKINNSEGDKVMPGDILVDIERNEGGDDE